MKKTVVIHIIDADDEEQARREEVELIFPFFRKRNIVSQLDGISYEMVKDEKTSVIIHIEQNDDNEGKAEMRVGAPRWSSFSKDYLTGSGEYACTQAEYESLVDKIISAINICTFVNQ